MQLVKDVRAVRDRQLQLLHLREGGLRLPGDGGLHSTNSLTQYETRIAVSYLKKIQEKFFNEYDQQRRNSAVAHSLKDFNRVLQENMALYSDKTRVDKLSELKKELT